MITKIDVDILKVKEQMIIKMGKKLRTASLDSKFTGSDKNCIALAFGMGGYWVWFILSFNTKLVKGFFLGIDY